MIDIYSNVCKSCHTYITPLQLWWYQLPPVSTEQIGVYLSKPDQNYEVIRWGKSLISLLERCSRNRTQLTIYVQNGLQEL